MYAIWIFYSESTATSSSHQIITLSVSQRALFPQAQPCCAPPPRKPLNGHTLGSLSTDSCGAGMGNLITYRFSHGYFCVPRLHKNNYTYIKYLLCRSSLNLYHGPKTLTFRFRGESTGVVLRYLDAHTPSCTEATFSVGIVCLQQCLHPAGPRDLRRPGRSPEPALSAFTVF